MLLEAGSLIPRGRRAAAQLLLGVDHLLSAFDLISSAPLLTILPGTMIFLTVLSLNGFGAGLRDALDPKSKVQSLGRRLGIARAGGDGDLMGRFIVRRTDRNGLRPLRGLGDRLPDLQRHPQLGSVQPVWPGKTRLRSWSPSINEEWGFNDSADRSST